MESSECWGAGYGDSEGPEGLQQLGVSGSPGKTPILLGPNVPIYTMQLTRLNGHLLGPR